MNRDDRRLFDYSNMLSVERPGRYIGGEQNVRHYKRDCDYYFCLAFPDLYDIGISYYGYQILYHIINRLDGVSCERAFLPWYDMQSMMTRHKTALYSLENKRPLNRFNAVGITLQTELHYPGVVKLLDLSGITRYAAERKKNEPVIIGGGPCAFHPEPVAPFFDAFLLGDGETAAVELIELMRSGEFKRSERIDKWHLLSTIDGVYVPGLYKADAADRSRVVPIGVAQDRITARTELTLRSEFYPVKPIVPLISGAHNRLTVEVMRGCAQGCRFCQAGILHRPVRERTISDIVDQVFASLDTTGWNEVGLLSLSTSDYSQLSNLLAVLSDELRERHVSVAFPSLRPASFTESMASIDTGGRKSSLTFAVEAGSQRLRDVINKSLEEDELLEAMDRAYRHGWSGVKLYFMVGLPTETDQDIEEGVELLSRVARTVPRGHKLHISVAPFIPKPHSVFEAEQFLDNRALLKRQHRLIRHLSRNWIKTVWRDPWESCIEAILARGDRRLAPVIEAVSEKGSGFEGWGSEFSKDIWFQSLNQLMPDWQGLLSRIEDEDSTPWGHLTKGITHRFLRKEKAAALDAQKIGGCNIDSCYWCGLQVLCEKAVVDHPETTPESRISTSPAKGKTITGEEAMAGHRYRLSFTKLGKARNLGHRDLMSVVERAIQRTDTELVYSRGYHPRLRMSFSSALPLGQGGVALWVEFEVYGWLDTNDWLKRLYRMLPRGVRPWSLDEVIGKGFDDAKNQPRYRLRFDAPVDLKQVSNVDFGDRIRIDSSSREKTRTVYLTVEPSTGSTFKIDRIAEMITQVGSGSSRNDSCLLSVTRLDRIH